MISARNLRCKQETEDRKTGHRNKPDRMNDAELKEKITASPSERCLACITRKFTV